MKVETQREIRRGKAMAVERTTKVTCDGCGTSVTFVEGKDKLEDYEPWLSVMVSVRRRRVVGQGSHEFACGDPIDACSEACAHKAIVKRTIDVPSQS